jgi:hypothetical protein
MFSFENLVVAQTVILGRIRIVMAGWEVENAVESMVMEGTGEMRWGTLKLVVFALLEGLGKKV